MTRKRKWTHSLFALALLAVFVSAGTLVAGKGGKKPPKDDPPPPEITLSYTMTLLGTLGGSRSEAWAMNEWGDVVGKWKTEDGKWAPFVYFSGSEEMVDLRDFLTQDDLDLWRWDFFFGPHDINSGLNGPIQICASSFKLNESGNNQWYAIRITLPQQVGGTAIVEIVSPGMSISSGAYGINEFGDVTGGYQLPGQTLTRAFVFTEHNGESNDIGDLGGDRAVGSAINNLGEITGYSDNPDGERRAFLFVPGAGMQDLGFIKKVSRVRAWANHSYGSALNDNGTVVGDSVAGMVNGSPVNHAFRETSRGMEDLGTLDGHSHSEATSINADGEIVGWSYTANSLPWRGFFYSSAFGMVELDALIDNLPLNYRGIDGDLKLKINDAGTISGTIRLEDFTTQAFVLTPNP